MLGYLQAKVVEFNLILRWIERELSSFSNTKSTHNTLLQKLLITCKEIRSLIDSLDAIVRIADKRLFPRALPKIHEVEFYFLVLTCYYIPALQKEQANDLRIRKLLLTAAEQLGFDWFEDMLICMDRSHATFASFIPEVPLIFLPPQHIASFLDLPGFYHELGHSLFQSNDQIGNLLLAVVNANLQNLQTQAGLLSPDKIFERNRQIEVARDYWNTSRLEELFCDIFATYVCGPAHYHSIVDLGLRYDHNPFFMNSIDVHPPHAARVSACLLSLTDGLLKLTASIVAKEAWADFLAMSKRDSNYDFLCANSLLEEIVDSCILQLDNMPFKRYENYPFTSIDLPELHDGMSLEDVLNAAYQVLTNFPEKYIDWQNIAISKVIT